MKGDALGVVLAGGSSRRFGRPKALEDLGGLPLGRRAATLLGDVVPRVVVITNDPRVGDGLALPWRADRDPGLGPAGGLITALRWAEEEERPGCLVLACDLPFIPPSLLHGILPRPEALDDSRPIVTEAPGPHGVQPLCAWYPVACLPEVERACAAGERALWRIAERLEARLVSLDELDEAVDPAIAFLNVNGPVDLERAREILAAQPRQVTPSEEIGSPEAGGPHEAGSARGAGGLPPIVCVVGWKDSGKTTVTVGLVRALVRRGHQVMTVKHGHGFDLDRPGTDSWLHRHEGGSSRVVLAGPDEVAVLGGWGASGEDDLASIVRRFVPDAEVVIAEGYKRERFPKIEVFRPDLHERPIYDPEETPAGTFLAMVTTRPDPSWPIPSIDPIDPEASEKLAEIVERSVIRSWPLSSPS